MGTKVLALKKQSLAAPTCTIPLFDTIMQMNHEISGKKDSGFVTYSVYPTV